MSGHKRCRGQWPLKEGYSADPMECSQSNVSPERELQVLGEIKKKNDWQMPSGVGHAAHSEL